MEGLGKIYRNFSLYSGTAEKRGAEYSFFSELILEQKLEWLRRGLVLFLVLSPKEPVSGCSFMQAMDDENGFRLEISLVKNGRNNIYATHAEDIESVHKVFCGFIENGILPDMTGWEYVGEFDLE